MLLIMHPSAVIVKNNDCFIDGKNRSVQSYINVKTRLKQKAHTTSESYASKLVRANVGRYIPMTKTGIN